MQIILQLFGNLAHFRLGTWQKSIWEDGGVFKRKRERKLKSEN
jgi:hypothetical protein